MTTTLVWLRKDLRIADNPALAWAAARGSVLPVFILAEGDGTRPLGRASRWWLHHSLKGLRASLGHLTILRGDPRELLPRLAAEACVDAVVWNRCYDKESVARDTEIEDALAAQQIAAKSFNGRLLFEPWELETQTGEPYKVFSAFWRAAQEVAVAPPAETPQPVVTLVPGIGMALDDLELLGEPAGQRDWAAVWTKRRQPGEAGARGVLQSFLDHRLAGYGLLRDRPDLSQTSGLSPHLRFGEISPRQIWAAAQHAAHRDRSVAGDVDKFLSELGWREFSYHLLYHFPRLATENWRQAFDAFPWRQDMDDLRTWQRGNTGYPLVDAGMRELWKTGTMHNRVRMVAASFLVKHLRLHWQHGERWFWDTLVDADPASNPASWQWVAGSGADAAPYFRVFNPVLQSQKFDPQGHYIRRWLPELKRLPTQWVHAPFEAPPHVLETAKVALGNTYPLPMVDHTAARAAALAGYEAVKAA